MTQQTTSKSPDRHREWAQQLFTARRDRAPIRPLREQDPDLTADDAYRIQEALIDLLRTDGGGEIVGYKLGLTSRAMQEAIGVDQPDYGPVLSSMVYDDGAEIELDAYLQPKIEAEMALVLDRPLRGPGVTALQAAQAVGGAFAALELIDSRIADWDIGLVDTIADQASSAAIIQGSRVVPVDGWDPRQTGMVISRNGRTEATGAGAAALGDPIGAVAWLANTLAPYDVTLEEGHVIMTGSLHAAFELSPGDLVRAEFDRLGTVTARFV